MPRPMNLPIRLRRAAVASSGIFLALTIIACGGGGSRETDTSSTEPVGELSGAAFASDFDSLSKWCRQSIEDFRSENDRNPIRGQELKSQREAALKTAMEGKPIKWDRPVKAIDPTTNSVVLDLKYCIPKTYIDDKGRRHETEDCFILAKVQDAPLTTNGGFPSGKPFSVPNTPQDIVKSISIGDRVTLTGTVSQVKYDGLYIININGAAISR